MKRVLLLAAIAGLAATAQAAVVNMNFSAAAGKDSSGAQNLNGTPWAANVAPLTYSGSTWNDFKYWLSDFTMLDSDGVATTVSYTFANASQVTAASDWTGTGVPTYLQGGFYSGTGGMTLTIMGLDPASQYDLYIAGDAANSHGGAYTVGSASKKTSATSNTSFVEDDNFVHFASLSPNGSNTIVVTIAAGDKGVPVINGFQLATAVPEPSTLALAGLVGAMCLRRHRR